MSTPISKPRGFHIAIDGPVAAGKSTIAKKVAEGLGFLYIDTGSMYRAVTLHCLRIGADIADEQAVVKAMHSMQLEVHPPRPGENHGRLFTVLINNEDVSWEIRTSEVTQAVPTVAAHPKVRAALVKQQRAVSKGKDIVMEGRDITYCVLPNADLKIYLTANEVVRAKRHYQQLTEQGEHVNFDDVLTALLKRDSQDMSRKTDPLKVVPEAWVVDSSAETIEQVTARIIAKVRDMMTDK